MFFPCYHQVLAKLEMFKKSVSAKPNDLSNKSGDGEGEDVSDWKAVRLKFAPESGKVRTLISNSKYV